VKEKNAYIVVAAVVVGVVVVDDIIDLYWEHIHILKGLEDID
jgi:hypothetical protein